MSIVSIVKEPKNKNAEFHTYKPKQERSFKVVLKYMHPLLNVTSENKLKIIDIW